MPDKVIAGHHADLGLAMVNGISPKDGRFFLSSVGPSGGGWGAKFNEDGMSATVCMNDGDTHNNPIEQMEAKFPLMYLKHGLRQNSGGPGRFRGGLGTEQIIMARSSMNFNAQVDRMHCQPWGLEGGLSGMGNKVNLNQSGEIFDQFPNAKVLLKRLNKGDTFTLLTGGGGGFGQGGGGFQANSGGIQGTGQVTQNNTPGSQLSFLYQLPTATQFQPGGGGFGQAGGGGGFGQGAGAQGGGGFGQNAGGGGFGQGGGGFGQGGGGFGQGGGGFGQGGGGFGQGGGGFGQGGGGFGQGGGGFGQGGGGGGFGGGGGTGGQAIGMDNPFYSMAMQGIMSGVGGSAFQSGGGGNMGGQNNRGGGGFGQGGGQFGGGGFGQGGGQFGGGGFGGGGQFGGGGGQFGGGGFGGKGGFGNGANGL
jgi:hypothetical protein